VFLRIFPQDKPESFELVCRGSTVEALQMASEALSVYWELVTTSAAPVDWRCQDEYAETFGSTTAELYTESPTPHFTGVCVCVCVCVCRRFGKGL